MQDRFENGIFGMISPEEWLEVGYDVTRPNDPTDQLFGDVKTDNLIAYWESQAANYGLPVMAQYHAFDVEAKTTMRKPIDIHNIEKGLIKVKIPQTERLLALMSRGVNRESALVKAVYNDGYNLADEVFTRSKVAKNELLATGKMTIHENNLDITIDYGVPAANVSKTLDFGAGAAKTISEQLQDLVEEAKAAGKPITGIYTSSAMISKLRKNTDLQVIINGTGMSGRLIRKADLLDFLSSEFGITRVFEQDGHYSLPLTLGSDGRPETHDQRLYPIDRISFFHADNKLGDGLWGDPPEVNAAKYMDVSESEVSPFVFVSQYAENDPAVVWTKASGLFVPVIYDPNALYVATAISTPAQA